MAQVLLDRPLLPSLTPRNLAQLDGLLPHVELVQAVGAPSRSPCAVENRDETSTLMSLSCCCRQWKGLPFNLTIINPQPSSNTSCLPCPTRRTTVRQKLHKGRLFLSRMATQWLYSDEGKPYPYVDPHRAQQRHREEIHHKAAVFLS